MATQAVDQYKNPTVNPTFANNNFNVLTNSNTTGTSNGSNSSNTSQQGTSTTNTTNMDPKSLAMLQVLIGQLMGNGTQQQIRDRAARQSEINNVTQQRAGYSKEAAFGDAQGLMAQTMRQLLEKNLPTMVRARDAAGTSGSALQALMVNDLQARTAEAASAQGLNAAVQYGGVANGMSSILEQLTRPNDSQTTALLNAFNVLKGAVTSSTTNSSQTGSSSGTSQANTTSNTVENKAQTFTPTSTVSSSNSSPTYSNMTAQKSGALTDEDRALSYAINRNAIQDLIRENNFSNGITFD